MSNDLKVMDISAHYEQTIASWQQIKIYMQNKYDAYCDMIAELSDLKPETEQDAKSLDNEITALETALSNIESEITNIDVVIKDKQLLADTYRKLTK